ncbi:hypothetical protein HOLleu_24666 [Holothuria leucospilota]|uniref:Ig-like domain-containing protein n=1 Tax=Holothuria leucospilota TaxID=206669 RepID=A0A9Q1H2W7_HOLLE|nr:hypothetical protein HOLleu_24666 [Holothuria leucospilota]
MYCWLAIFTLISCCCVTRCKTESPCRGSRFRGATSYVCRLIAENISLTCNVPTNCTRGLWKYDNTINATWLVPEEYSGETYLLGVNSSEGLNTLHIYNINERVEGFYTCFCEDYNRNRTTHGCFNLSVHVVHCPISVLIKGEKLVLDRCGVRNEAEMVDVEVNENITIKCDDEAERITNCSHTGKRVSFTVNPSHHLCGFSCRPKNESVQRKVNWVILNVMNKVIITSTAKLYTEIFSSTKAHLIGDVSGNVPPDQRWISNILHIIMPSSLVLVFGIVVLTTCACVLFYKTRAGKLSLQCDTHSDGDVYDDVEEMQPPDTSSFDTRHSEHGTDLEDADVILSDIDDITNDSVGFQFYDEPDAYFTVNKVGPKVSMDGTVGKAVYNKVQKTPVEMKCAMSCSPNTGGDMDTYTGVADVETHGRDDTESNVYALVDRNAI